MAPITVNGINNNVNTVANVVNACTFVIAFCIFLAKHKTPTNANNGIAIAVNANTPTATFLIPPICPIKVNGINNKVIAVANKVKAPTLVIAFLYIISNCQNTNEC